MYCSLDSGPLFDTPCIDIDNPLASDMASKNNFTASNIWTDFSYTCF